MILWPFLWSSPVVSTSKKTSRSRFLKSAIFIHHSKTDRTFCVRRKNISF
jgi:hypothetical protein